MNAAYVIKRKRKKKQIFTQEACMFAPLALKTLVQRHTV